MTASKSTNMQLKKIGQTMRSKFQTEEKKVQALEAENKRLEAELAAKQDAPSEASNTTNEESGEAVQLLEALGRKNLRDRAQIKVSSKLNYEQEEKYFSETYKQQQGRGRRGIKRTALAAGSRK